MAGPRPSAQAPTIRDVAERARVAPATVSNVLTGRRQVAENRRRRVLEAETVAGATRARSATSRMVGA